MQIKTDGFLKCKHEIFKEKVTGRSLKHNALSNSEFHNMKTATKNYKYFTLASTILMFAVPIISILIYGWDFVSGVEQVPVVLYLEPAGYSFIIWVLIYLGFLCLGIFQTIPSLSKELRFEDARPYIIISALANVAWIISARFNEMWIMFICTLLILFCLIRMAKLLELGKPSSNIYERLMVKLPLGAYFGWITLIAPLSTTGFLIYNLGLELPSSLNPELISVFALTGFVTLVLILLFQKRINFSYLIVIIWGLFAIFIANLGTSNLVGFTALGMSIGLLITFLIIDRQRVELEKMKMEMIALRNQVNPHFLFNNLNTLSSLIPLESRAAHQYLEKLANFYRFVVNQKNEHLIPLSNEIKGVRQYVDILKERFGEHLKVHINHDDIEQKLILQLLVENAVKHNSMSSNQPLTITISPSQDLKYLKIENNKNERFTSLKSTGIGLKNIKTRYGYYTKRKILVESHPHRFLVQIPLIEK